MFSCFSHPIASFSTTFDILPIRLVNSNMTTTTFAEKKSFTHLSLCCATFAGTFPLIQHFWHSPGHYSLYVTLCVDFAPSRCTYDKRSNAQISTIIINQNKCTLHGAADQLLLSRKISSFTCSCFSCWTRVRFLFLPIPIPAKWQHTVLVLDKLSSSSRPLWVCEKLRATHPRERESARFAYLHVPTCTRKRVSAARENMLVAWNSLIPCERNARESAVVCTRYWT